jgi:hypothetical protein
MTDAPARAIWETWSASPAGIACAPEGGPLSWDEMVAAAESGKFPSLAEMVTLCREEASAAIRAYENERQSKP